MTFLKRVKTKLTEDRVLVFFAIVGFLGGAGLHLLTTASPIVVAIFFGTGIATLVYRFLGGIPEGTTLLVRGGKLTGSLAVLMGTAWLIDGKLVEQSPCSRIGHKPFRIVESKYLVGDWEWQYAKRRWQPTFDAVVSRNP